MPHRRFIAALLLAGLTACTPSSPAADPRADEAAVRREGEAYLAALRTNDIDSIAAHWTDSMIVMPPNTPMLRGREAVRAWVVAFLEQSRFVDGRFTESAITVSGDLAVERVAFSLTVRPVSGGDPMVDVGKGLHVYQRQADGSWRLAMDIWNANAAP